LITKRIGAALWLLYLFLHPGRLEALDLKTGQLVSATQSPTWIAREAGYFEKNGLTLQAVAFRSGPVATQSLIAHEIDLLTAGGVEVINANLKGAGLVFIAQNVGTFPYTLYVGKRIQTAKDLKAGKLAISGFGGPSEFLTRYAVEKLGLDPKNDVTLVQVGTQRFAALATGSVDGAMIQPPDTLKARELGLKPLLDFSSSGIKFPFNPISTRKDFLASKREIVLNFMRGYLAGMARFHKDRAFSMAVMAKYLKIQDEAVLNETYAFWSKIFPRKPYTEKESIATYLRMIAREDVNPEPFFDNTLINELDRGGYIDSLYPR
jgi:NitT/TauT family transport system substrate-binding protein